MGKGSSKPKEPKYDWDAIRTPPREIAQDPVAKRTQPVEQPQNTALLDPQKQQQGLLS